MASSRQGPKKLISFGHGTEFGTKNDKEIKINNLAYSYLDLLVSVSAYTKKYFETHGFSTCDEEIIMDPQTQVDVPNEDKEKVLSLSSKIEELDDVQNVYMNVSIIQ